MIILNKDDDDDDDDESIYNQERNVTILFHWLICVSVFFCHSISYRLMYWSIQLRSYKSV